MQHVGVLVSVILLAIAVETRLTICAYSCDLSNILEQELWFLIHEQSAAEDVRVKIVRRRCYRCVQRFKPTL